MHPSSPPYVLHPLPMPAFFIRSPKWHLVSSTEHRARCCVDEEYNAWNCLDYSWCLLPWDKQYKLSLFLWRWLWRVGLLSAGIGWNLPANTVSRPTNTILSTDYWLQYVIIYGTNMTLMKSK
jgi:hypothetical protein